MHRSQRAPSNRALSSVEVKSKFGAEFRRFSLDRSKPGRFDEFYGLLQHVHRIPNTEVWVGYADVHGDLLPINNDDNYHLAIATAAPLLRLFLQRKEEAEDPSLTSDLGPRRKVLSAVLLRPETRRKPAVVISLPRDFRPVSSIIDVDILPETHRRVRLYKHGQDKPLGFYIRDGSSVRVTPQGLEKVPGIFISRMVPGGLAEGTGLLAVNDEVLEVNGIEVAGKSLDQVTDMMIANSHNLIITVKPANQRNNVVRARDGGSAQFSDSGPAFYGLGLNSAPAPHIVQNFPAGALDSEDEEDVVLEADGDMSFPRYEPHLHLRPARSGPAPSGPTSSGPAPSGPTSSGPTSSGPTNGALPASAGSLSEGRSVGSLEGVGVAGGGAEAGGGAGGVVEAGGVAEGVAKGSNSPESEGRSLEEDGTVITL